MSKRNVPNRQHASDAKWSDMEVLRFASYSQQALCHSMGRNARIVKVLCYLSQLRGADKIPSNANFKVVAAIWQNYSSVKGNEAAHYLPGQLMVNSKKLSLLAQNPLTATKISCLFGDVEDLPADFNKADTQAEAKGNAGGLCAAFEAAAQHLNTNTSTNNTLDRAAIRRAYHSVWVPKARLAFTNALSKKADKYSKPELEFGAAGGVEYGTIMNLSERESASTYQNRIDHQQEILHHYLSSLNREPSELSEANMSALERSFMA